MILAILVTAITTLAAGGAMVNLPLPVQAALTLPAALLAPGWGWAARFGGASRLQRGLDAAWISILLMIPTVSLLRLCGGGHLALLAWSLCWGLLGAFAGRRAPPSRSEQAIGPRLGMIAVVVALASLSWSESAALTRPLDAYWYHPDADAEGHEALRWAPVEGLEDRTLLGWEEAGAARLSDPEGDGGVIEVADTGRLMILLRGPVGASLTLSQGEASAGPSLIEADVIEVTEEGAVPRYMRRGAVAVALDVIPGEVRLVVRGADSAGSLADDLPVTLYVIPGTEAVWSLHASGELRFVHYYQLLNIVENLRWAEELLESRWLTVNQPPLWSYVLAIVPAALGGGLIGANLLMMWVLGLLGASALRLLSLLAPEAPGPAWLLPGLAAATVGKLMLEPGSTTFPDPLYAAALIGGLAALRQPQAGRFAVIGVLAGALRYPGVIALTIAAGILALLDRRLPKRHLGALWGLTAGLGLSVGLVALLTGQLEEWLFILWFETGPEHFHGEYAPSALLSRPPEFYGTWLRYTGYGLLAALPLAGRGAKLVGGWALLYSLLLCTIDHFPSHYFLPLVMASAVAVGANAGALASRPLGWLLSAAACVGALHFLATGWV